LAERRTKPDCPATFSLRLRKSSDALALNVSRAGVKAHVFDGVAVCAQVAGADATVPIDAATSAKLEHFSNRSFDKQYLIFMTSP
jgi:hypothetical protein